VEHVTEEELYFSHTTYHLLKQQTATENKFLYAVCITHFRNRSYK